MNELEKLEKAKQDIQDKIDKLKERKNGWYKNPRRSVWLGYYDFDKGITFGFRENSGLWYDSCGMNYEFDDTPATNEEVEAALIKEAKRRGFKKGVRFDSLLDGGNNTCIGDKFNYIEEHNELYFDGWLCFEKGQWAEVIEEPKVVINGYEMKQEGDIISFGCAKFDRRQLECFYADIFSDDCDGFNTWCESNRKIKSITLDSGVEITTKQLEEIVKTIK